MEKNLFKVLSITAAKVSILHPITVCSVYECPWQPCCPPRAGKQGCVLARGWQYDMYHDTHVIIHSLHYTYPDIFQDSTRNNISLFFKEYDLEHLHRSKDDWYYTTPTTSFQTIKNQNYKEKDIVTFNLVWKAHYFILFIITLDLASLLQDRNQLQMIKL